MDRKQMIILVLVALLLVGAVVSVALLWPEKEEPTGPVVGEFVPVFDATAQQGRPTIPDPTLDYRELTFVEGYPVGMVGRLICNGERAYIYFAVSGNAEGCVKVKISDTKGNLLGESGLIRPGEYVEAIPLTVCPEESCQVNVSILHYESETYYSKGTQPVQCVLELMK